MTSDEIITFLQLFKQKACTSLEEIAEQYYVFYPYISEERKSSKNEIIHTTQTLGRIKYLHSDFSMIKNVNCLEFFQCLMRYDVYSMEQYIFKIHATKIMQEKNTIMFKNLKKYMIIG